MENFNLNALSETQIKLDYDQVAKVVKQKNITTSNLTDFVWFVNLNLTYFHYLYMI